MHKINNIRRLLAVVASLAALLVVATIAFRMNRGGDAAKAVRKLPVKVDVSLQRIHFTETRQGVKRWDLSAERAEYNKDSDSTTLVGVRLVVLAEGKAGELQLSADRADYKNSTKDVTLSGNVRGTSTSGMDFSTSRITYVAARSQLETGEPVRFSDGNLRLEGTGMEFHTQTRRLKLKKDVSAVFQPQGAH